MFNHASVSLQQKFFLIMWQCVSTTGKAKKGEMQTEAHVLSTSLQAADLIVLEWRLTFTKKASQKPNALICWLFS